MTGLSETQRRALCWMRDYPSTEAAWTVDGKSLRAKDKPEKWNVMRIAGTSGSILITKDDLAALRPFIIHCTAPDKMYDVNIAGHAALRGTDMGQKQREQTRIQSNEHDEKQ